MAKKPAPASTPRKDELRRRLSTPAVVNPFPVSDWSERKDSAVRQWKADLFEFYDVDPADAHAWEQLAWRLAVERFPGFEILARSNMGREPTTDKVDALRALYESKSPRLTLPKFLRQHPEECAAAGLKTQDSLRDAFYRSRKRQADGLTMEERLVRFEIMRALGLLNRQ